MTYYIDMHAGLAGADGLTPETARRDYRDLALQPGDTVLFKRGSFIRDSLYRKPGTPECYITYGAYGEGEAPVFCGSVDVSDPALWEELAPHIWKWTGELPSEVCNFVFDGGRIGGTLRWEEGQLSAPGDWYDNHMGLADHGLPLPEERRVLLWADANPGKVYSHIEAVLWGNRCLSVNVSCTAVEDLAFFGSGVHVLSGGCDHMTVRRCSFTFIGGAVWNRQLQIRFGNAIEFWNHGEDILIEDCYFNNIYDSCITHQGGRECEPARNLVMRRNLFVNYGMGAYEGRDRMSIDSSFTDNLCLYAGGGFTGFGDTKPRHSEIYPQPMGHHLFMWRIPQATENGGFTVANNRFYEATGSAMYSIISPEAEAQMHLSGNRYYTTNRRYLTRIGGKMYAPADFEKYLRTYGEPDAEMVCPDIAREAEAWFRESGAPSYGAKLFTDALPVRKYFVGGTEKNALQYAPGEEMRFSVRLTDGDRQIPAPLFHVFTEGDDGRKRELWMDGATGEAAFSTSVAREGCVHVLVTACDAEKNPLADCDIFEGGAAAGFDKILQTGKVPADYDAFWERVITEELDPVAPVEVYKEEWQSGDPGDIVYDVRIACPGPNPVSGYLRMPRNAEARSLPIVVLYMGYNVTAAQVPNKWNSIQLCINQQGEPNGMPAEYYAHLGATKYAGFGFDEAENRDPDTVFFKYMVLRAIQAVRYCMTLPAWDGVHVKVCGGSMGGFQAIHAAAHELRVTEADIAIPWLCDLRAVQAGRLGGWRPAPAAGLDYYDTVCTAARVLCPVEITAGLGDYVCPPSGVTALYHALPGHVKLRFLQNRTHPYTAPEYDAYTVEK